MADPNRLRPAIDAALALARSGIAASAAVDDVRTCFDLTDTEREQVVASVCTILDRADAERCEAVEPVLRSLAVVLDAMSLAVIGMRKLAKASGAVNRRALQELHANVDGLAVLVCTRVTGAQPLLCGANLERADRLASNARALRATAKGILS